MRKKNNRLYKNLFFILDTLDIPKTSISLIITNQYVDIDIRHITNDIVKALILYLSLIKCIRL